LDTGVLYSRFGLSQGTSPKQVFTVGKRAIADLRYQIKVTEDALTAARKAEPVDYAEVDRLKRLSAEYAAKLPLLLEAYATLLAKNPYYENLVVRIIAHLIRLFKVK